MAAPPPVITISSSSPASQARPPHSTHRLATQSAAEALRGLTSVGSTAITSGLNGLDRALTGGNPTASPGFERGKVAEVWGPAGSGTTSLAFQTASEAVKAGGKVTWIDCATLLSTTRLRTLQGNGDHKSDQNHLQSFRYVSVPTLSHLLAMILHPPASFPPEKTTLLVVDDLNTLVDLDYQRMPFGNGSRNEQQKWLAGRRYAVLSSIVKALSKLAVLHNMAVIVTTGCSSRMRSDEGLGAAIGPGVGGGEWESGIWSRIVVFRDFNGRFAGVQKCQGRNILPLDPTGGIKNAFGFEVMDGGSLKERHITVDLTSSSPIAVVPPAKITTGGDKVVTRKRQYEEVADSEDEDLDEYGWAEKDDDALAAETLVKDHTVAGAEAAVT